MYISGSRISNTLKKQLKYLVFLCLVNFSFASGGWLDKWLTVDWGLTLWTILTFFVLLFILRWKAWGPLMEALDARARQIEEALSKAEIVAAGAKEHAEENEKILAKAKEEAHNIISDAKKIGEKLKNKLKTEGQAQYESLVLSATADIEVAKNKALNDIRAMVVDIALEASEKIIKRNLNNEDNKNIIEETVKSFQQKTKL